MPIKLVVTCGCCGREKGKSEDGWIVYGIDEDQTNPGVVLFSSATVDVYEISQSEDWCDFTWDECCSEVCALKIVAARLPLLVAVEPEADV